MTEKKEILIAGAGPSGLAMAIFLSDLGYHPRIVDKKSCIGPHSKALGVNPRTLQILEQYNLTERFLANGRKMEAINIWKGDKHIYRNEFSSIKHKYPFMLIQPQKESEEIFLEEVQRRGMKVEYETELLSLEEQGNQYITRFSNSDSHHFDYVIGSDGGHSIVRESIGLEYEGFSYDEKWEIYDIELETNLNKDEGHIRIFNEGGMIMIRLKGNVWRVAGNMTSLLDYIPKDCSQGNVDWHSTFRIHHKVANRLSLSNAAIIGDAAHLHSPVGARGMNLGIEDAFIASKLLHSGTMNQFTSLRQPYLMKTVDRINRMTTGMAGDTLSSRLLRRNLGFFRVFFPLVMPIARRFLLGLN